MITPLVPGRSYDRLCASEGTLKIRINVSNRPTRNENINKNNEEHETRM